MIAIDVHTLAGQCFPAVAPATMEAIVHVESGGNPYAIGVVGGHLQRQPRNKDEALATVRALKAANWNFSTGISQVNRYNWAKYGMDENTVFDPCTNLRAGGQILADCYQRASGQFADTQTALRAAFSCYYSGNFVSGYRLGYVQKVEAAAKANTTLASPGTAARVIPVIADSSSQPASHKNKHRAHAVEQASAGKSTSEGVESQGTSALVF